MPVSIKFFPLGNFDYNLFQSSMFFFPSTVRCAGNTGIMFLNEVALGKEHHITMDDSSLVAPPKGFESVVAKGRTEPGK